MISLPSSETKMVLSIKEDLDTAKEIKKTFHVDQAKAMNTHFNQVKQPSFKKMLMI